MYIPKPLEDKVTIPQLAKLKQQGEKFTCLTAYDYSFARLIEDCGVEVVLASRKTQAADQEMFRHVGVEPGERRIVALKSSVHFRADFQPIAEQVIVAAAPGPNPVDHLKLDYRHLRPGVRLMPGGPLSAGPVSGGPDSGGGVAAAPLS